MNDTLTYRIIRSARKTLAMEMTRDGLIIRAPYAVLRRTDRKISTAS